MVMPLFSQKACASIVSRVDRHLFTLSAAAAAAAGIGVVGIAETAEATVVYSGSVNHNVPANFTGIYLNMVNGVNSTVGAASVPGWDVNPWVSGGLWRMFPNGNTAPNGGGVVGAAGNVTNMAAGASIGPASGFLTGSTPILFTGTGFAGIRLLSEADGQMHFGWVRFNMTNGTTPGTIMDYAIETTPLLPIGAGDGIPEPASLGLLAAGALGLMRRRAARA
jgi:hypothetical protein